jgi:Rad3-related DNA helicase
MRETSEETTERVINIIEQYLIVTHKNILIFFQNKSKCKECFNLMINRQKNSQFNDNKSINYQLINYIKENPHLEPLLPWWDDVEIFQDESNLSHERLIEILTYDQNKKRKIIVTYFRSVIAEGIDIPSNSLSVVLCIGVPYENIKSVDNLMINDYYVNLMKNDEIYKRILEYKHFQTDIPWLFNKSSAINALQQATGRSVRNSDTKVVISFIDKRLTTLNDRHQDFWPSWINNSKVDLKKTPRIFKDYCSLFLDIFKNVF